MPIVYVKNKSNAIIHVEEAFSSLVWTERYQDDGEFEIDLPLKKADASAYKKGNYVLMDDSDVTMIIETLETNDDDSVLKVSGRSLSSILDRRVNASKIFVLHDGAIQYSGDFGSVVSGIVADDITNAKAPYFEWGENSTLIPMMRNASERNIPNFKYINEVTGVTVNKKYDKIVTIHDIIVDLSKRYVAGFRIDLDDDGNFVFKTYQGKDRTGISKDFRPVIFGPTMDNVLYVNSFNDTTEYKNCAVVIQDYEESDEDTYYGKDPFYGFYFRDGENFSGLDRREVVVNGENSSGESTSELPEGATESPNLAEMREAAAEEAFDSGNYDIIYTTEGAVDPLVQYQLGVDYNLGDKVKIEGWTGAYSESIIDEIVRSYDSSGYIVTPNFKSMYDYDYGEEDDE